MTIDKQKLDKLLSENNFDEVREYLKIALNAPMTAEERGEAILYVTTAYMNAVNSVNAEYKEVLEDGLLALDEINKEESKTTDAINLKKVRSQLN